jgi:hypothetical protein
VRAQRSGVSPVPYGGGPQVASWGLWKDPRWSLLTELRHRARRSAASEAPWQRTIRQPLLGRGCFLGKIAEFTVQLRTDDVLLSRGTGCPAGVYLAWTAKVTKRACRFSGILLIPGGDVVR